MPMWLMHILTQIGLPIGVGERVHLVGADPSDHIGSSRGARFKVLIAISFFEFELYVAFTASAEAIGIQFMAKDMGTKISANVRQRWGVLFLQTWL